MKAPIKGENAGHGDEEICFACGKPFVEGQLVLPDVNEGLMHAACCGPEREAYVGDDGEPLKDGEPIPTGFPWSRCP